MRKFFYALSLLLCTMAATAQKKPLDHSVYDGWQSIGERSISNNGQFTAYTITPQEGDGTLVVQALDNSWKKEIPRGYAATITPDSRFLVFKLKPFFKDTREARIKKKTPNDMPKDTLGILEIGKDSIIKVPKIKSFKTPEKGTGQWLAYLLEKAPAAGSGAAKPDSLTRLSNLQRMADSLVRVADSLKLKLSEARTQGLSVLEPPKKETKPGAKPADPIEEGTELVLRNLYTGEEKKYALVSYYEFSKNGNALLLQTTRKNQDTLSQAALLWTALPAGTTDTIMRKFNLATSFSFDEEGAQLAFVAERDSIAKALVKFYKLYYYKPGLDSARLRVDRSTPGMPAGFTVSESGSPQFSKNGLKLFISLAPIRKPKDTTLVDFETARLDVWSYKDDYLQPQQLVTLSSDLRRSLLAVLNDPASGSVLPLSNDITENVALGDEGNADHVLLTSSKGYRAESQWQGFARQAAYIVSTKDGTRKLIRDKQRASYVLSPKARYVLWYDFATKHYWAAEVSTGAVKNITQKITTHLYDDEDDHPDDPYNFGAAGWLEDDAAVLIYDRYDIWQVDPTGVKAPINITNGYGKKNKLELRYWRTDREARFLKPDEQLYLEAFNRTTKYAGYFTKKLDVTGDPVQLTMGPYAYFQPFKAKNAEAYLIARMNIQQSDLYASTDLKSFTQLSQLNPQQKDYNWLNVELVKWKMFDGKEAEGMLFKPENFDPTKKYPVIFYFYEKNTDNLFSYRPPAPSASTVNIPYFVSNGYLVFDPNIYYKNGEPGESAYNSVVSAAKFLAKKPWVDSTKMAIQGQSWGGYQVAYLVTRTKLFAAAGAGAPVANMTSAYGGIRWGSGMNRQFQYERSQSRIGATLWQKPELYIRNSPLFKADKVTTPLLIMHNDNDGAVPWYQGIEYFTALKRLGKQAWLLQYNGEDHNLVERRNRKDLSVRLAQFFDHYLKGAPAPRWMTEGVPATEKGIEWGL
ncbi:MAG: prolyl oligopeptidase family serine peptidase [Candidatus Pseudobacter hemicellulosilyticus]|uniref:Prolyl oligopeptidase family serine peptidase n=1 Tax=Candidatus Pseudobacter hemicellulosilyticus TaxID=3121375 RepID=A0AAJ5WR20_9BACT|nr:MAG: prolyl oligopeptidase family serine peptidase [Pseudobacter sp.]